MFHSSVRFNYLILATFHWQEETMSSKFLNRFESVISFTASMNLNHRDLLVIERLSDTKQKRTPLFTFRLEMVDNTLRIHLFQRININNVKRFPFLDTFPYLPVLKGEKDRNLHILMQGCFDQICKCFLYVWVSHLVDVTINEWKSLPQINMLEVL